MFSCFSHPQPRSSFQLISRETLIGITVLLWFPTVPERVINSPPSHLVE